MKEQTGIIPTIDKDKVIIVGQNEQAFKEVKWHIKPKPGHTLFEINMETGDAKPAEYEEVNLQINDMHKNPVNMHIQFRQTGKVIPQQEIKKKLITKPDCIYISALNIDNAAKEFIKRTAVKWWSNIPNVEKDHICKMFFKKTSGNISNKEIIKLWHMENAANAKK